MSGKLPWMKFYPADWSQDTTPLSLAGRGAWITIVCAMWRSAGRGKISMPLAGFCRLLGTTEAEASSVIDELIKTGICNAVTGHDKNITLTCRRMVREEKHRNSNALRQKRYRVTHGSNVIVTGKKQKQISEAEADKKKSKTVFEIPLELNTPEFLKAWENWKQHRKEIRKPLTEKSIEMQMKDFTAWGAVRAIAAIEYTIKKGWQGIREEEKQGGFRGSAVPRLPPPRDKKREHDKAVREIVLAIRELKKSALTSGDVQDGISALRDKYHDLPGALTEALEIVS